MNELCRLVTKLCQLVTALKKLAEVLGPWATGAVAIMIFGFLGFCAYYVFDFSRQCATSTFEILHTMIEGIVHSI